MHKASLKEAIFRSLLPRPMVFGISPTIPDISYLHKIKKRKLHGVYVPPVAPFSDPALIPDDHTGRRLFRRKGLFIIFRGDMKMPRIINGEKNNIVGENIRILRVTRRMSQQDLADKLDEKGVYVCRGSISRIEDGLRTVTDIELKGFSEVFNVTVNDLFVERDVFGEQVR